GEALVAEHAAGVAVAGGERDPGRAGADALREGDRRLGAAVPELARDVRAPAPELPGPEAAGVGAAGAHLVPADVGADAGRGRVVLAVVGAEVAGLVRAPAPEAAVDLDGAGVRPAGRDAEPLCARAAGRERVPDRARAVAVLAHAVADRAAGVVAPAPERAVHLDAAAVTVAEGVAVRDRDLLPQRRADADRRAHARLAHAGAELADAVVAPAVERAVGAERAGVVGGDRDLAEELRAGPAVSGAALLAGAGVAAGRVGADGVRVAGVGAGAALVDVGAGLAVAAEARLAHAGVGPRRVGAGGVGVAGGGAGLALVDVGAD